MKNTKKKMVNVAVLVATIFTLLGVALDSERYVMCLGEDVLCSINYKGEIKLIIHEENLFCLEKGPGYKVH